MGYIADNPQIGWGMMTIGSAFTGIGAADVAAEIAGETFGPYAYAGTAGLFGGATSIPYDYANGSDPNTEDILLGVGAGTLAPVLSLDAMIAGGGYAADFGQIQSFARGLATATFTWGADAVHQHFTNLFQPKSPYEWPTE